MNHFIKRRLTAGNEILHCIAVMHSFSHMNHAFRTCLSVALRIARRKGIQRFSTAVVEMRHGRIAEITVCRCKIFFGCHSRSVSWEHCENHRVPLQDISPVHRDRST